MMQSTTLKIAPGEIGFDFDGVICDIGEAFLRIACEEHGYCSYTAEDITSFQVDECLNMPFPLVEGIFNDILRDSLAAGLMPMPGMVDVVERLAEQATVTIITARPQWQPVADWLDHFLPSGALSKINLIAMGDHDGKLSYIREEGLRYFVDDRTRTCEMLFDADITPVVFSQPWNRNKHSFHAVESWREIQAMLSSPDIDLPRK
jgi:5'(3')-deoxyribonucleotidase